VIIPKMGITMAQQLKPMNKSIDRLVSENLTENRLNELDPETRLEVSIEKIMNGKNSESQRWDCLIIISELYVKLIKNQHRDLGKQKVRKMKSKIESTLKWMIHHEKNCVVHHEVAYQVAARNITSLVPDMVTAALHSKSVVSRHEYLECLGVMKAFDELKKILPKVLKDKNPDVRETAEFAKDRLSRYANEKDWSSLEIV
jgi:hypothetical protein